MSEEKNIYHSDGDTFEVKGEGLSNAEIEELRQKEQAQKAQEAYNRLINSPLIQAMKITAQKPPHVHGPFTFLMNQNHKALRGCQSCGDSWVGVMAGTEDSIRWHEVQEPPEEEEE